MIPNTRPPIESLPGGWEPKLEIELQGKPTTSRETIADGIFRLNDLLSETDITKLLALMEAAPQKVAVSVQGLPKASGDEGIGSERVTIWFPSLAMQLYQLMQPWLENRIMTDFSRTDWWQHGKHTDWQFVGLSPLLRFMQYTSGAQHFPHYDAAYMYPDNRYRSLMSVIFYLTTHSEGAATRFLIDGQHNLPEWERQHEDWQRPANAADILLKINPNAGAVLVFDHRLLHDAEVYTGIEPRIIVRADLVFKWII